MELKLSETVCAGSDMTTTGTLMVTTSELGGVSEVD